MRHTRRFGRARERQRGRAVDALQRERIGAAVRDAGEVEYHGGVTTHGRRHVSGRGILELQRDAVRARHARPDRAPPRARASPAPAVRGTAPSRCSRRPR